MYWKITDVEEYSVLPQDFRLPASLSPCPIALLLQKEGQLYCFALPESVGTPTNPPQQGSQSVGTPTNPPQQDSQSVGTPTKFTNSLPAGAAVIQFEALYTVETWRCLLRLYPIPKTELANYWLKCLAPAGIPADGLMQACGLEPHYKNRRDWEEAANLDRASLDLAYIYNLPLRLLRLWNRLTPLEQQDWLRLWQKQNFPVNIVADIIADYYELQTLERDQALQWAKEREARFRAVPGATRFPVKEVRDRVRLLRFPQSEHLSRELYRLKKRLSLPSGVQLEIPQDLESSQLKLIFQFDSAEKLKKLFSFLNETQISSVVKQILAKLR